MEILWEKFDWENYCAKFGNKDFRYDVRVKTKDEKFGREHATNIANKRFLEFTKKTHNY